MNTYKNKQAGKYIIIVLITFIISMLLYIIITGRQADIYRSKERESIIMIVSKIKEKYPEVEIEEIIDILNSSDSNGINNTDKYNIEYKKLLRTYGIDENTFAVRSLENLKSTFIAIGVSILLISGSMYLICFFRYLKKRKCELSKLENYIGIMATGDYNLDLKNNSEDELSSLKNQLYKLMVNMKEQANSAVQNKVALSQSVSDISHQLKTPLTSTQILLDNVNNNPDMEEGLRKKFIYEALNQVNGMNWMIVSMLKLSRIDAGVVEFNNEIIHLYKLIEEAVDNLAIISEIKNVEVEISEDKDCIIKGDYNWNREALQNIIKNAIEHSETKQKVIVRMEDNDVYSAVYVTNKGKPLTSKQQKQIFERYYSEAKYEDNSMGIGLPLAKAVIEKQGGYITVESNEKETTFIIKYIK